MDLDELVEYTKDPKTGEYYVWFRDCYWQNISIKWIKAVTYFAQQHGMGMVSIFFTETFVYCNSEYGKLLEQQYRELLENIEDNVRTHAFYAIRDFIKEIKESTTPTPRDNRTQICL